MDWVRQQDFDTSSLRKHGCALAAGVNGMHKASGGKWKPGGDGTAFAKVLLDRSGATNAEFNARGITSRELFTALSKTATDNSEWMPLRIKAYHGGLMTDMLAKMEEVGGVLLLAVRNKVLVKAGKTQFETFDGGHWGVVTGKEGSQYRWIAGERSPILLPLRVLTDAADQFGDKRDVGLADDSWGDGRGEGILLYEWDQWREGYASMKRQRDTANKAVTVVAKQRDEAKAALAACEAGQADPEALKSARQSGIDAATERARTTPNP